MTRRIGAAIWLSIVSGCGFAQINQQKDSRFFVTGDRIYALQSSGGGYGSEGTLYASDDGGQTWSNARTPTATCDVAENGGESFALTSKGEIWKRRPGATWTLLKHGSSAFGQREYLYNVVASRDGPLFVTTSENAWLLDRSGKLLERIQSARKSSSRLHEERFVRAWFATADEQDLIVEATPYAVYVFNLPKRKLVRWTEGAEENPPQGLIGPCRVIPHGDGYLLSTHNGVYVADGLLMPWRRLTRTVHDDYVRQDYCRAFCSFVSSEDQWLMADGAGIHLMQGGKKLRTVFEDQPDEHDLIRDITLYEGRYFVSFYRLEAGVLGAVLSQDLASWKTVSLDSSHN